MIEAILMIGDRLAGVYGMHEPLPQLRLEVSCLLTPITTSSIMMDETSNDFRMQTLTRNTVFFDLVDSIGYNKYVYQFRQSNLHEKYTVDIQATALPFEPTDGVNMDILKNKLRNNKKLKKLLIQYYQSEL